MEDIKSKIKIKKFEKYLKNSPSYGEMIASISKILLFPKEGDIYNLFNYVGRYFDKYPRLRTKLKLRFTKVIKDGTKRGCVVIGYGMPGKKLDPKKYKHRTSEDLEKKLDEKEKEMPEDIFDAVNSKVHLEYQPGLNFAHARYGITAKKRLIKMFPENEKDIKGFTAKQAKFFYYTIRKRYG